MKAIFLDLPNILGKRSVGDCSSCGWAFLEMEDRPGLLMMGFVLGKNDTCL